MQRLWVLAILESVSWMTQLCFLRWFSQMCLPQHTLPLAVYTLLLQYNIFSSARGQWACLSTLEGLRVVSKERTHTALQVLLHRFYASMRLYCCIELASSNKDASRSNTRNNPTSGNKLEGNHIASLLACHQSFMLDSMTNLFMLKKNCCSKPLSHARQPMVQYNSASLLTCTCSAAYAFPEAMQLPWRFGQRKEPKCLSSLRLALLECISRSVFWMQLDMMIMKLHDILGRHEWHHFLTMDLIAFAFIMCGWYHLIFLIHQLNGVGRFLGSRVSMQYVWQVLIPFWKENRAFLVGCYCRSGEVKWVICSFSLRHEPGITHN